MTCITGKICYPYRIDANLHAKTFARMRKWKSWQHSYFCDMCSCYHLTSEGNKKKKHKRLK